MIFTSTSQCALSRRQHAVVHAAALRSRTIPRASAGPPPTDVLRVRIPALNWSIENAEGKRLSIAVFSHMAATYGGKLTREGAVEGLSMYGSEVVEDARQRPGAHPNIELLLRVIQDGSSYDLVVERQ